MNRIKDGAVTTTQANTGPARRGCRNFSASGGAGDCAAGRHVRLAGPVGHRHRGAHPALDPGRWRPPGDSRTWAVTDIGATPPLPATHSHGEPDNVRSRHFYVSAISTSHRNREDRVM